MLQNQYPGEMQEDAQSQQQVQEMQNDDGTKPEVENPQPVRKVEEPITATETVTDKSSGASKNNGGKATPNSTDDANAAPGTSDDYQRSNAGFQPGDAE